MAKVRLDKYLSHIGLGTRTEVKKLIRSACVTVDDQAIKDSGFKVDEALNRVMVKGHEVKYKEYAYMMLNKPKGVLSARQDKRQETVIDLLDHPMKKLLFPVGRLDKNTTGLLMLTNNGELTHRLLSPSKHVDKTYIALIEGKPTKETVETFLKGVRLEDGYQSKPGILKIKNELSFYADLLSDHQKPSSLTEVSIIIREGKYHQIKRMFESVGMKVMELHRQSMGSLKLDENLQAGESRLLTHEEIRQLLASTQLTDA